MLERLAVLICSSLVYVVSTSPVITTVSGAREIEAQAVRPQHRTTTMSISSNDLINDDQAVWQLQAPFFNSFNPSQYQAVTPFRRVTLEARNDQIPRMPLHYYQQEDGGESTKSLEFNEKVR